MHLFVYGTLKSGQPNNYLLTDGKHGKGTLVGKAATTEKFPLIVASRYNVPYLLEKPGTGQIVEGEIYDVDDELLAVLDDLESHPVYYERKPIDIRLSTTAKITSSNSRSTCYAYYLVKFVQTLLDLPMHPSYHDQINGLRYVKPNERPPGRLWWHEIHTGYVKTDAS